MNLSEFVSPEQVRSLSGIASKKRALEELSRLLVKAAPDLTENDVLTALVNREKLGSTALDGGVAIPHGRMRGLDTAVGAFVRLDAGVDFEASDGQPVDLIFGLLVPQEATQMHLDILKTIAERLSDDTTVSSIRNTDDDAALHAQITGTD